jgi:hypothetical protein
VVVIDREITSHSCNFALSIVVCALAVCLAVLVGNVAYEAFLPFLNTRDLTDALYSIAGSALGALYLCRLNRCGFRS